jgi:tetrathionate reductase subunit C
MNPHIIEIINVTRDIVWGIDDAHYLFMIGASAAALLFASLVYVLGLKRYEDSAPIGLIVALSLGLAAPFNLIANLSQPGRFYSLFYHTHSSSPMSWGTFILTLYLLATLAHTWTVLRGTLARRGKGGGSISSLYRILALGGGASSAAFIRQTGAIAAFFALAVITYTGVEVSVVRAVPLWHSALVPILFITVSLVSGVALVVLVAWFVGGIRNVTQRKAVGDLLFGLLLADLFLQALWLLVEIGFGVRDSQIARQFIFQKHLITFIVVGIGGTVLLPALLLILPSFRRAWGPLSLASLLATIGAWIFRWNMVIGGQEIPKTSAGFYSYTPVLTGHDGVLDVVANIAFALFLLFILTWLFPTEEIREEPTGLATTAAKRVV